MEAHRPKVVSADTTEFKAIPLAFGDFHILEALSPLPDSLKKGTLVALLVRRQFLIFLGCAVRVVILREGFDAEPNEGQHQNQKRKQSFFHFVSLYEAEATELLFLETSLTDMQGKIMMIW